MVDFNARDPNAWADRNAQGAAGEQAINHAPLIFSNYPAVDLSSAQSMRNVLYPPGQTNWTASLLGLGGISGLLGNMFGGGGGSGGVGGPLGASGTQYAWAPGMPVAPSLQTQLAQQPASFWNGVQDSQHLGLGRGFNMPGGITGGGGSFGL